MATDVVGAWARAFYTRDPAAETYAALVAKCAKYMTPEVASSFTAAGDPTYDALKTRRREVDGDRGAGQRSAGQRGGPGRHTGADHAVRQGHDRGHRQARPAIRRTPARHAGRTRTTNGSSATCLAVPGHDAQGAAMFDERDLGQGPTRRREQRCVRQGRGGAGDRRRREPADAGSVRRRRQSQAACLPGVPGQAGNPQPAGPLRATQIAFAKLIDACRGSARSAGQGDADRADDGAGGIGAAEPDLRRCRLGRAVPAAARRGLGRR